MNTLLAALGLIRGRAIPGAALKQVDVPDQIQDDERPQPPVFSIALWNAGRPVQRCKYPLIFG